MDTINRNEILSFFSLFVLSSKFEKRILMSLYCKCCGALGGLLSCQKTFSAVILRNCGTKSSFWWHTLNKAKIEVKKDAKNVQN